MNFVIFFGLCIIIGIIFAILEYKESKSSDSTILLAILAFMVSAAFFLVINIFISTATTEIPISENTYSIDSIYTDKDSNLYVQYKDDNNKPIILTAKEYEVKFTDKKPKKTSTNYKYETNFIDFIEIIPARKNHIIIYLSKP